MAKNKIQYFTGFDEDLVETADQNYQLKDNFKWIRTDWQFNFLATVISAGAKAFGYGFNKLVLRQRFANLDVLKPYRGQGYFIYANHTQPVGDVFLPMLAGGARKYYVICAQANLGMPIIGPLLPYGGAMPIPSDIHRLPSLIKAVDYHIKHGDFVMVYPEAHVWPYYTGVRPFSEAAFHFPITTNAPSFVMTNTYQKARRGNRPQMITYLDGPIYPDSTLPRKERQRKLMQDVKQQMEKRAALSDVEYVKYVKRKEK